MPKPEGLNPIIPDIESLCAMHNILQAQATLATRQSKKSAEVCQLKKEIAKLHFNLTNFVSG